jgi:hypothetical protein
MTMEKIVSVGQVWKDRDKRRERFVHIISATTKNGKPAFMCQSVVPTGTLGNAVTEKTVWQAVPKTPTVAILAGRFGSDYSFAWEPETMATATPPVAA